MVLFWHRNSHVFTLSISERAEARKTSWLQITEEKYMDKEDAFSAWKFTCLQIHYPFQKEHFFMDAGNLSHQGIKVEQNHRRDKNQHMDKDNAFYCTEIHMVHALPNFRREKHFFTNAENLPTVEKCSKSNRRKDKKNRNSRKRMRKRNGNSRKRQTNTETAEETARSAHIQYLERS